jgi:Fur family ferric uptake transcriptional regulator
VAKIGRKGGLRAVSHDRLQWEEVLWAAGHRVTRQRSLILDAVCAGGGHTTLGEVYARVRRRDRSIDRSTIYRALHLFVQVGLVVAADTGKSETFYEIVKPQPHHHLVCRQCDAEQEIGDAALCALAEQVLREYRFRIATDHLVIFGLCERCLAAGLGERQQA